ncbi:MAG: DUF2304 domain-containing protein [Lachnospiraceae bacterium]|nr:DUF2304 domain-containing protein [Lachnospiraceae bacterium]
MTYSLRALILLASLVTFLYVLRRIRKAQLQLQDSLFWIFLAFVFVIMGAFPQIVYAASRFFGFQAPVNLIFLVIIFILLLKVFLSSIKISQLENKLDQLVQELAIDANLNFGQAEDADGAKQPGKADGAYEAVENTKTER